MERISGKDRYEISLKIAEKVLDKAKKGKVYLASGEGYADALAASPLTTMEKAPILLIRKNEIPQKTQTKIKEWDIQEGIIVGGEAAVSSKIQEDHFFIEERIAGKNRYDTALEVLKKFLTREEQVYLTTGKN